MYWFTNDQWDDYISRRGDLKRRILSQLCNHVKTAVEDWMIDLTIGASNSEGFDQDNDGVGSSWRLFHSEWGGYGDPITICPWCGRKLPDIPKIYIGK